MEGGASGAAASPSDLRKAETLEDIWSELPVAGAKLRASLCLSKRGVGKSRSFIFPTHIRHLLHCQSWPVWCSWANCTGPGPECLGLLHCSLHCSLYCLLLTVHSTTHSLTRPLSSPKAVLVLANSVLNGRTCCGPCDPVGAVVLIDEEMDCAVTACGQPCWTRTDA